MESHELAPGSMIRGKYRITRKLGQGGMGVVYQAEHILLGGRVALKFLTGDLGKDPKFIKRFRMEARAAYQLRHPNIVEVTDLDQAEDGSLFIAMDYVEGPSLRAALNDAPAGMEIPRALELGRGIASGLAEAHRHSTVHRDIKPENILLSTRQDGLEQPKILDFGIAAITESVTRLSITRGLMLTPDYAAPEQWDEMPAAEMDGRTDLYALGGVLYEMLTGRTPFHAHNTSGWMKQHLTETPRQPSELRLEVGAWPGLDGLTMRLLAKNRDDRPQDAELLGILDNLLYGPGQQHPEPPKEFRQSRPGTVIEEGWQRPDAMRTQPPQPAPPQISLAPAPNITQSPTPHFEPSPLPLERTEPKPAVHKISEWTWGALGGLALVLVGSVVNFYAPQFLPQLGRSLSGQSPSGQTLSGQTKDQTAQKQPGPEQPSINPRPVEPATTAEQTIAAGGDSKAETKTQANPPATAPAEPEKAKPSAPQPLPTVPVQQPSASELSQQAISLYGQKRYSEASALFDQACTGGGWEACKDLGNMYRFGNGVVQDYPHAASLYTKACNAGNARSCANLGFLYASGSGVVRDDARAAELYTSACNAGDGMGCSNLGNVYASGRGVGKDDARAASLYLKACAAGDGPGCSNLGNSYRYGRGVDRDTNKARQFLDKGCKMGNQWGCDRLKEIQ